MQVLRWIRSILLGSFCGVMALFADEGATQESSNWSNEIWGSIGIENRLFLNPPSYPGQHRNDISLTLKPSFSLDHDDGSSIVFTPYLRVDGTDSHRTHFDNREAYYLRYGSFDETEWELRIGIDQVFWGTAESNNPVNIINQTDLVEGPPGDEKLGQPMIHGTLSGEWGTFELFILPYHRPRTFPGASGRLRAAVPVSKKKQDIIYEHSSGKRHIDLAARYSNSAGPLDFGISVFDGTSREPHLVPAKDNKSFQQHYNQIKQVGLDLQLTLEEFIGKAEIMWRNGFDTKGPGKSTHNASVIGGEYALSGVFGSDADLVLFAEWNQDSRGKAATTLLQNDMFYAARYTLNDFSDTSITAALVDDLDYRTKSLNLEYSRRLSDSVTLKMVAQKFLETDQRDQIPWQIREDEYVTLNILYSF